MNINENFIYQLLSDMKYIKIEEVVIVRIISNMKSLKKTNKILKPITNIKKKNILPNNTTVTNINEDFMRQFLSNMKHIKIEEVVTVRIISNMKSLKKYPKNKN